MSNIEKPHERILVVDDSKVQLFAMGKMLEKEGYVVFSASEPLHAKRMLENSEFDLLLCDLIMPDMDGIAMLKFSKSARPIMPVVIMTAFGDRESAIEALKDGAEDYIFKASGERERDEFLIRIRRTLEKSKLQKKILAYQNSLEHMVDERTKELRETQEKLIQSERLRSLGVITTGVAHDFNNILGVILGRTQMLIRKMKSSEIVDDLLIIEKSALKGSSTIKRMQDYTRIRKDETFVPVQMNEIIDEVIEITKTRWKDEAENMGISIEVEKKCDDIPYVTGNASELKDVLINVLFNAFDSMVSGGRVTVKTYLEHIHDEQWVTTEVSDTGCGIAENIQSKIFDPFFTTKSEHGTGLGMSTAYGIIQRHKGEITFKSKEKEGTTFYIRLMAALFVHQVMPENPIVKSAQDATRQFAILVVDDDEAVRSTLAEMLEIQGHDVSMASSGPEAIRMIMQRHYEIIFTDLGMPGMSGWELSQEIRQRSPQTHVVMITGWGTQLDHQKAAESNVKKILPKPVSYDEIIHAVNDYIETL
ncbi:response regulator [bacterium]|nr:response regulator [bacterium]